MFFIDLHGEVNESGKLKRIHHYVVVLYVDMGYFLFMIVICLLAKGKYYYIPLSISLFVSLSLLISYFLSFFISLPSSLSLSFPRYRFLLPLFLLFLFVLYFSFFLSDPPPHVSPSLPPCIRTLVTLAIHPHLCINFQSFMGSDCLSR